MTYIVLYHLESYNWHHIIFPLLSLQTNQIIYTSITADQNPNSLTLTAIRPSISEAVER